MTKRFVRRADRTSVSNLGVWAYWLNRVTDKLARVLKRTQPYRLRSRHLGAPVVVRPGTSDRNVFWQLLEQREYSCLDYLEDAQLVFDLGANVGYASCYFLSRFPNAQVVAVEPDPGNFAQLCANVKPYGKRCTAINAAVWHRPAGLVMSEEISGDGREWSRTVRECGPDEPPALQAVGIRQLLDDSGRERISLLKMDIEGAELGLLSQDTSDWLPFVDNWTIETHGEECDRAFWEVARRERFDVTRSGTIYCCRRSEC